LAGTCWINSEGDDQAVMNRRLLVTPCACVQGFIVTDATITATVATRFTDCPAEPSASSSPTG
jgi:hypothetical protein